MPRPQNLLSRSRQNYRALAALSLHSMAQALQSPQSQTSLLKLLVLTGSLVRPLLMTLQYAFKRFACLSAQEARFCSLMHDSQ